MADTRVLRRALVDKLRADGQIRSARVAAAFQAVPRELFVPGIPLDDVYRSSEAILVKRVDGVGVSSASAPDVMAVMLEQLDIQPGLRILEIGAGTGYNAALLAYLVGEQGTVVSVDIDADLVAGAREHLALAGYATVEVVEADGALGYAAQAPYDRIMLTVASRDLAPAWSEQLAPGGRLLLPLSLRGTQRCVTFERADGHLVSLAVGRCSFIPLRGVLAMDPLRLPLDADGAVTIGLPEEVGSPTPERVSTLLSGPTQTYPSDVRATTEEVRHGLQLWVAAHDAAVCSLWADASAQTLPDLFGQAERFRGTFGLVDEHGLALLAWAGDGELCIQAPRGATAIASRLVEHVQGWALAGRPSDGALRVRAYPRATRPEIGSGEVEMVQRWTRFVLSWARPAQPPATLTV